MHAFSHKLSQVTYPRMERQDLTQGQLGSFKFTPIDDVRSSQYRDTPWSTQPYTQYYASNPRADVLGQSTTTASNNECSAYTSHDPDTSPTRFDSTYFDSYIKPDLDKSRLLLGPSALRVAVDGAPPSPPKQHSGPKARRSELRSSTMEHNSARHECDYTNGVAPISTIPTFVLGALRATQNDDASLLHTSLIRALASEQQAHEATKQLLEIERSGRIKAEEEAQKYLEHNRSLIGSVNMLKSVVQHNVKKEQLATQQAEVSRYYQAVEKASPPQTILHDAVRNLRKPAPAEPEPKKPLDSKILFDFDLLEQHGSPALRKHFSTLLSEQNEGKFAENETKNRPTTDVSQNKTEEGSLDDNEDSKVSTVGEITDAMDVHDESVVLKAISNNIPKVKSDNNGKMMAMPFDPLVNWKQNQIFDSHNDKFHRIGYSKSIFAEHPVRYFPDLADKNIYRTVMIDFLPIDSTYAEILHNIRGGGIESIQLHGPIGHSTQFMTARIVFHYERSANGVYLRGQDPGLFVKGKRARVWQVLEATYPRDEKLEAQIFDEGYTRILIIEGAIDTSLAKLPKKLASQMKAGSIIEIGTTFDGIPMIEFTSVAQCVKALELLMNDPEFGGCKFDFEDDPCNDKYPQD